MNLERFLLENIPGLTKEMLDGTLKSKYKSDKWFKKRLPQGINDVYELGGGYYNDTKELYARINERGIGDVIYVLWHNRIIIDYEITINIKTDRFKDKHNKISNLEYLYYHIKYKCIEVSPGFDLSILKQWKRDNILEDILN